MRATNLEFIERVMEVGIYCIVYREHFLKRILIYPSGIATQLSKKVVIGKLNINKQNTFYLQIQ